MSLEAQTLTRQRNEEHSKVYDAQSMSLGGDYSFDRSDEHMEVVRASCSSHYYGGGDYMQP